MHIFFLISLFQSHESLQRTSELLCIKFKKNISVLKSEEFEANTKNNF